MSARLFAHAAGLCSLVTAAPLLGATAADMPPHRRAPALDSLDLMLRGLLQVPQAR